MLRRGSVAAGGRMNLSGNLFFAAGHQSSVVNRGRPQTALGRHKSLPSSRPKGFSASDDSESKLSVDALGKEWNPQIS
jgi:hypothetical protein